MPIYCVTCVSPGKKRKCASYGPEGGKRTHCSKHKIEGEIHVHNKRCKSTGCKAFANWGDASTKKRTYCGKHRNEKEGLVNVVSTRCKFPGCTVIATYGVAGTRKAEYCQEHCEDGNVNVKNHQCIECSEVRVKRKGDLCAVCDVEINGASRIIHIKENDMVAAIKQFIFELDASIHSIVVKYDESIGASYGSYRPDIHIDCGTYVIVIECDEFQHKPRFIRCVKTETGSDGDEVLVAEGKCVAKYDETSETKRMISIQASRGKPCYVLRFNPDPFKIGGVTSRVTIADRYVELRRQLTLALSKPPSSDLVVKYLFYDNDDESYIKTKIVAIPKACVDV